jgi:hypothetical protein
VKKVAFLVSRILGPVPLLCLLWLTTAVKSGIGFWKALWVYPLILLVTLIIPTIVTTYLITVKKVADIEWISIKARRRFLLPIGVYSLSCLLILTYLLTNRTIFHLTLLFSAIVVATILIYAFTNFKISAHIVTATTTIAAINLFFNQKLLWLFLLLIPIIWARYTLKVHTLKELIAGFILSSSILILALCVFGWPKVP